MMRLSHRPQMTLGEYYAKCARCPFKDMRNECKRGQGIRSMGCYNPPPIRKNHLSVKDHIREMLEEDRELMAKLG